jgi:AraC-like DNA-binding protein
VHVIFVSRCWFTKPLPISTIDAKFFHESAKRCAVRRVSRSYVPGSQFLWVRGIAARETLHYLQKNCIEAEPLLAEAGFSRDQLLQERSGISATAEYRFLELAATAAADSLLGLHLAAEMDLGSGGIFYYLAYSSATVVEALENMARYVGTTNEAVLFELSSRKDTTVFTMRSVAHHEFRRQWSEFAALALIRALRVLTRRDFAPLRVRFAHARKSEVAEVQRLLGCPIEFARATQSWVFPQSVMALPIWSGDRHLLQILRAHADDLLAQRRPATGLRSRVEKELVNALPSCSVKAAKIAQQLGVSTRSLTRYLAEECTTFSEILDDLRNRLARRYLEDQRLPLNHIARHLGYSGIGAFNHAFKRWTGTSPGRARKQASMLASAS